MIDHSQCTGCGLCAQICPKNCITMTADEEGFLHPRVETADCIHCGLCESRCPVALSPAGNPSIHYRAAILKDERDLLRSSSGGVFLALAKDTLAQGGLVCGCVYNEAMEAVHICTRDLQQVQAMCGSKYVQSRFDSVLPQLKAALKEEQKVLFTGTACQVAAVEAYLGGKHTQHLTTAEILCHGVPSPALLRKYVAYLEKKLKGRVLDIQFRNKETKGWGSEHRTCVIYEKQGRICKYRPVLPAYFSAFFYGLNLRQSCYQCPFAREARMADLTLGDYWGSWVQYGKRFDEGISVVAANTDKGLSALKAIEDRFSLFDTLTPQAAVRSNDNFRHPIRCPRERKDFYRNLQDYRGLWKRTYFTKTYRRKTLASVYGAFVPAKLRFALQTAKLNRRK